MKSAYRSVHFNSCGRKNVPGDTRYALFRGRKNGHFFDLENPHYCDRFSIDSRAFVPRILDSDQGPKWAKIYLPGKFIIAKFSQNLRKFRSKPLPAG